MNDVYDLSLTDIEERLKALENQWRAEVQPIAELNDMEVNGGDNEARKNLRKLRQDAAQTGMKIVEEKRILTKVKMAKGGFSVTSLFD